MFKVLLIKGGISAGNYQLLSGASNLQAGKSVSRFLIVIKAKGSPLLRQEGWLRIKKMLRSHL